MNNLKVSPFPYKETINGKVIDGTFLKSPIFCKRFNTENCKKFYREVLKKEGIYQCPYGFSTDYFVIDKQNVIFTGLNIEKHSDRRKVQKNLSKKDFSPKITEQHYLETKKNFIEFIKANSELAQTLNEYTDAKNDIEENKEILDNTFHELRKLNMQLKRQSEKLNFEIDKHNVSYQNIKYLCLNIFATSRLISTRLNTYDFGLNPELISNTAKKAIKVFKKIEKVAHCLKVQSDEEKVRIQLEGNSYNSIEANDVFELLPFLLLENAIKYSPQNEQVTVKFFEYDNTLTVRFRNLGPRPEPEEIPRLTERGVRSVNVNSESGFGLGLYLANFIADLNSIDFKITIDKEIRYLAGKKYSDFIVDLKFKNMITNAEE